ncbi:MAG: glycoside hydrolase family 3 protein, partial [Candidatus Geothermincolia bacterium]
MTETNAGGTAEIMFDNLVQCDDPAERERLIGALVSGMSLEEKIDQMSGSASLLDLGWMLVAYGKTTYDSGGNKRLGIPPIKFTDGPRGVCLGNSTCFPVAMARAATWDVPLQERVGSAMGIEARSQGANFFGGLCLNVPRHPGWGRAQETFGEDPYLLGAMSVSTMAGAQRHVMACAKHFACNSMEEARFFVDVQVDERTLREIYLPHFKKCVDAGVASIMSAYNQVNGDF